MKYIFIFTFFVLVSYTASAQQKQSNPIHKYYQLKVRSNGVLGSVLINGVEQTSWDVNSSYYYATEANRWLVRGKNELQIRYTLPPNSSTDEKGKASVEVILYWATPDDEEQTPERTLVDYSWSIKSDDLFPRVFTQPFELPDFPETMLAKVEPFATGGGEDEPALLQGDKQEILAQVHSFASACLNGNADMICKMTQTRSDDIDRSRYRNSKTIDRQIKDFQEFLSSCGKLEYEEPETPLQFRVIAGNKIVHVLRGGSETTDYTLAFTYKENDTTQNFFVDLYFAKIDGQWTIIR